MSTDQSNHYQVLMLDPGVDHDLLVTVYRRHVQRNQSLSGGEAAAKRLEAVEQAYAVLRDPYRRARYDAELASASAVGVAPEADVAPAARVGPAVVSTARVTSAVVPVIAQRASQARTVPVSVLDFGRYAGWSLRRLAMHDPNYLEWLLRAPGGRQYHSEITALLRPR